MGQRRIKEKGKNLDDYWRKTEKRGCIPVLVKKDPPIFNMKFPRNFSYVSISKFMILLCI